MSGFIQLHLLTSYPPSNLNRDDLGSPKHAIFGGKQRLRISSQALKRAWRTSPLFKETLGADQEHLGTRTREMGFRVYQQLLEKGVKEKLALETAQAVAGQFGKIENAKAKDLKKATHIEQLAHISPAEREKIDQLVEEVAKTKEAPSDEALKVLRQDHKAVDIALFGRMLAANPEYGMEAAAQVAHGLTTHSVAIETDYFTAVDDLNTKADTGAAHVGEVDFGAGLFYLYLCVDLGLLLENLQGDPKLAAKGLQALLETATRVAPGGKQATFGSRAYAHYGLLEFGPHQPRNLSAAFLEPIQGQGDWRQISRERLETARDNLDRVYGACWTDHACFDATKGEGSLEELKKKLEGWVNG